MLAFVAISRIASALPRDKIGLLNVLSRKMRPC